MGEKTCTACGDTKPEGRFQPIGRRKANGDPMRRGVCDPCRHRGRAGVQVSTAVPRFTRALGATRYIITSAQNATPVHEGFLAALKRAAKRLGAEIVVVPVRYRNPTSRWGKADERDDWWAPEITPYLHSTRKKLHPHLVLAADVRTQPTASAPLSGFEALTGAESCIIAHPKMQFKSVPVPTGRYPKILTTTGACTARNYTPTKAGKLGEFHHCLGALIVEIDGPQRFHLRQINADRKTGAFTDLDTQYFPDRVPERAPRAQALIMGDTHVRITDPGVDRATFGPSGIVETLDPERLVFHDLYDGESCNPHDRGDPFIARARAAHGRGDVRAEIEEAIAFLAARIGERETVIVASNHHDFLRRWVVSTDWRQDPSNAPFYLETAQAMLESVGYGPGGAQYADPFQYWINRAGLPATVRTLATDESYKVAGIELGMHGNFGPNGARATVVNLARLGARSVTGHGHAPEIFEGHYRVGTSTPRRLAYQRGPGSHLNTHCVVYASGARALLTVVESHWRLQPCT